MPTPEVSQEIDHSDFANAFIDALANENTPEPKPAEPSGQPEPEPSPEPKPVAEPPKEPEAAPAPDASTDPLDAIEPIRGLSTKASDNFRRLKETAREQIAQREREIQELKQRLDKAGAPVEMDPVTKKKLETYDQVSARLEELEIQAHPLFVERFVVPIQNVIEELTKETGADRDKVEDMILSSDKTKRAELWEEITQDLSEFDRQEIASRVLDARKIVSAKEIVLKNREQALRQVQQDYATAARLKADEEHQAHMRVFENVVHSLRTADPIFAQREELRPIQEEILTKARAIYSDGATNEQLAAAAIAYGMEPHLRKSIHSLHEHYKAENETLSQRVKELEAQIASKTRAEPRRSGGTVVAPASKGGSDDDEDFASAAIRMLSQ